MVCFDHDLSSLGRFGHGGWAALAGLLLMGAGALPSQPLLPGIGEVDRRHAVDASTPPWSALVRVQTELGARCSGSVVGPQTVITAAHCLYRPAPRAFVQANSVHVLRGYARGRWSAHSRVARYQVGAGYDPAREAESIGADLAVLTLERPVALVTEVLPLAASLPAIGTKLALAGYNQDRAEQLMADVDCSVLAVSHDQRRHPLIVHDCSGTRGTSGAPLLTQNGGRWMIVGVQVAAAAGEGRGIAAAGLGILNQRRSEFEIAH